MENGISPWQMQCPNNKQETKSNQIQLQSTWTHLRNVESAKYLGCLISLDLRWTKHINSICGKANKTLEFLRRNLNIGSTTVKQNAYNSLVRPIVEYASTVWDPYTQKDIHTTGTCFIQKIYAPSSSLLQGKHLPFTPSPLRLNIFRLFVILSLTQSLHSPDISLFDCHI